MSQGIDSLALLWRDLESRYRVRVIWSMTAYLLPKLEQLPESLPLEGAVRIELVEGIPVFRASSQVQTRIESLLTEQSNKPLDAAEERELDTYEELDDYLSLVNRTIRNLHLNQR